MKLRNRSAQNWSKPFTAHGSIVSMPLQDADMPKAKLRRPDDPKKFEDEYIRNSKIFVPEPAASPIGVCFRDSYELPFSRKFVQTRQSKIMDDMREKHQQKQFYLPSKDTP